MEPWGCELIWPCVHRAVVLGEHDFWHPHWCPVCDGRREPECDVEYLDVHGGPMPQFVI